MSETEGRAVAGLRLLQHKSVTRGAVNKRTCSGELLLHKVQKWLKGIHNDFLGGLNQKVNGCDGSKARGYLHNTWSMSGYNMLWVNDGPHILGEYPMGVPFLFIYKKGKGNLIDPI